MVANTRRHFIHQPDEACRNGSRNNPVSGASAWLASLRHYIDIDFSEDFASFPKIKGENDARKKKNRASDQSEGLYLSAPHKPWRGRRVRPSGLGGQTP
jgi:hypothetical protein